MSNFNHLDPLHPIGIFDSGVGGLTIARALVDKLPNENIIYFGDTDHFPYGDKSMAAIQEYSIKIADVLLKKSAKVILIACNSASSAAFDVLRNHVGKRALVLNVIDPMVGFVKENCAGQNIGLIATQRTVASNVYQDKIAELNLDIKLTSVATPLLIAAIEEGLSDHRIIDDILKIYLDDDRFKDIEALILGCTHYPLVKERIAAFYNEKVKILDPSHIVADFVASELERNGLLNNGKKLLENFYVSDYTDAFAKACKMFFSGDVKLESYGVK